MSAPDVIVTAPLPPFLYDPLKRDFTTHDYYQSEKKQALLAAESPRIRGLVQGGGTVRPTDLLDAASATTASRSTIADGAASRSRTRPTC